jgi:uncharacterized protein (DUF1778 family)
MNKITFSMRPYTFGEIELVSKVTKGDVSAIIDLIVARSERVITREYVCSLTESDIVDVSQALADSFETATKLRKLFGGNLPWQQ